MSERVMIQNNNDKFRGRLLGVEAGRIAFLIVIMFITFYYQIRQPNFLNHDILKPLYVSVLFTFLFHAFYLIRFDRFTRIEIPTALLFIFDATFITLLIYYTGISQSIFIFLYLVNIIFCGFIFHKQGALFLALFTSILYSSLFILRPDINSEVVFFSLTLNNLGFFSVAGLSGYLSEQLGILGLELIQSKKNVKELQDLNRLIIDNVASGLITVNQQGVILLANKAAEQILDADAPIKGRQIYDVVTGLRDYKDRLSAQSERIDRFELAFINERGDKLLLGFSVSPLKQMDQSAGHVLIFQDLTKIKRLERSVHMSEKMAAVGQLAAGIAHEIRNPLAGISGSIQLLRATTHGEGSEEYRLMSIAIKEIDRLNRLITDFLDFVRPPQPATDPVDLKQLISEVVDMIQVNRQFQAPAKPIKFEVNFVSQRRVVGHRDQLKQVFYNLVINASHAIENREDPRIYIDVTEAHGCVVVKVRDNGAGMSVQTQKRIFEPFFTTKSKGTGLGLATVHKIIENHDAKIFVESELDKGTEFTIEFSQLDTSEAKKRA